MHTGETDKIVFAGQQRLCHDTRPWRTVLWHTSQSHDSSKHSSPCIRQSYLFNHPSLPRYLTTVGTVFFSPSPSCWYLGIFPVSQVINCDRYQGNDHCSAIDAGYLLGGSEGGGITADSWCTENAFRALSLFALAVDSNCVSSSEGISSSGRRHPNVCEIDAGLPFANLLAVALIPNISVMSFSYICPSFPLLLFPATIPCMIVYSLNHCVEWRGQSIKFFTPYKIIQTVHWKMKFIF